MLLKPGTDIAEFNKKIFDLVRTKTEGKANHRSPFSGESEGYLYGRYENGVLAGGRIDYVNVLHHCGIYSSNRLHQLYELVYSAGFTAYQGSRCEKGNWCQKIDARGAIPV